jgi:hypothetical protein
MATTEESNYRMKALFRKAGFTLRDDPKEGAVAAIWAPKDEADLVPPTTTLL